MTHDPTTDESVDTQPPTDPDQPGVTDRDDPDSEGGRSGLLRGAAASLAGLVGFAAVGGTASAAGTKKHIVVVGNGSGQHSYTIKTESGSISKASHAGWNDTETRVYTGEVIEGNVRHWNADSYVYTGEIDYVAGDGSVSFHFPDQGFQSGLTLSATGQGSGSHSYAIASIGADLEFVPSDSETNDVDNDGDTESSGSPDRVEGHIQDTGFDTVSLKNNTVQNILIDGQVKIE